MNSSYRIISIEACDIYGQEQENGVAIGYKMPESKSDAYFRLFKNKLDYSLDLRELEVAYNKICRRKFGFEDNLGNCYTLAVINVKFNYTYKSDEEGVVQTKKLRQLFMITALILAVFTMSDTSEARAVRARGNVSL